ncbi:MAG TPA: D-alanyl-D-alanine carboxypeptidase [Actinomycetota bacterium]|nr:D-alanyl-D-alanine carboxypeptidase [Actinomycetota bacterium]
MRTSAVARPLRYLALALGLLGPIVVAVPAGAATTTAEISTSAATVDFGDPVAVSVTLAGEAGCLSGRAVTLDWSPADSAVFATIASAVTAADGSVALSPVQPHTGRYRASVQASGGCSAATSAEVSVRVRVRVDASVVLGSGEAGSCVTVIATVQPARPGQTVDLQRRRGGAWATIEPLTLGPASNVVTSPCFGFEDAGLIRLRVRWAAQDALNATGTSPVLAFEIAGAPWMLAIEDAIGGRQVSVAIGEDETFLYAHDGAMPRIPASNTKLLLSMAMLDALGPDLRIRTSAAVTAIDEAGVVEDLWILGRGDPGVSKATLGSLAEAIADAGVTRVRGRVMGSTDFFRRDWDAVGWNEVARDYVNRPTALTFAGNDDAAPERRAAGVLAERLEALGVRVAGRAGSGLPPAEVDTVAFVRSKPLDTLLQRLLRPSDNFAAEVLGKRLGVETAGVPGTIAKGAAAIEAFADGHGADVTIHDSSGLSYANRVTAEGLVRLLWVAEDATWLEDLRDALPTGGQGTLQHRLHGIQIRAKTGSLSEVSALSGWVLSDGTGTWVEFSILCSGMAKATASSIEDEIVRIVAERLDAP